MRHTHRFILVVLVTLAAVVTTTATLSAQDTPTATITQGMPQTTYETSAVFYFSSSPPGSTTFDCKLDYFNPADQSTEPLYGWSSCASPKTYTGLTYGRAYAFFVKSQGAPESTAVGDAWSILVPAVTFDSAPDFYWQSSDATLTFHSTPDGVPLECKLVTLSFPDQNIQTVIEDWHGCTSPQTFTDLDSGLIYGLFVKPAGARVEVAVGYAWVVVLPTVVLPTITIDSSPPPTSASSSATFTFHSTPTGVSFECLLSRSNTVLQDWTACTSPKTYTNLQAIYEHTFAVKPTGAPDNAAASYTWTVTKQSQTISFGPIPAKTFGDPPLTLSASASSGLPVSFGASGNCTVSGSTVSITGAGSCTVTASQSGNESWFAATSVVQSFDIAKKTAFVAADNKSKAYGDDNPALTAAVAGQVVGSPINYSLSTTAGRLSGVGTYPLVVTLGSNPNYNVSKTDGTLTIEPAPLKVTPDGWEADYSDPNPAEFTFGYSGWIEGEGPTAPYLTTAPLCSTTREHLSPAGAYPITCSGGAAPNYEFVYEQGTFIVTTDSARIAYTGDTQATIAKEGAKATVTLAATLEEEQDGLLGVHLGGRQIVFGVYGFGDTTYANPVAVCTATIGNVAGGKGYGSCNVELDAADPYQVRIGLVDNDYYTAEFETVVVPVSDPGTRLTAGGGWLIDPNTRSRANFGFVAKFLKNGKVQGNSLFVYRVTIDLSTILLDAPAGEREYNWLIKSNAMQGLNIYDCDLDTTRGCKATITGKNTVQAVDRLTGVLYSIGGNYQFQVDIADNQEPGSSLGVGPDQYAIRVWSTSGTYYELGDTYDDNGMLLGPLDIVGGNIQVKAKK